MTRWWEIGGLSFIIDNCNLTNFNITYGENSTHSDNGNLTLKNSFYTGSLNDRYIAGPFVIVNNGKLFVVNTTISEISSSANAVFEVQNKSTLYLINSIIRKNNVSNSVLSLMSNSSIHAVNCTIEDNLSRNYSIIFLSNSNGKFISCEMTGNSGNFGGVILIVICDTDAQMHEDEQKKGLQTINITDCFFAKNHAVIGGCIYLDGNISADTLSGKCVNCNAHNGGVSESKQNVYVFTDGCTFNSNSASKRAGCIYLKNNVALIMYRSIVVKNMASTEAGVMLAEINCCVYINDSNFKENKALSDTGAISLLNGGNLTITGCSFQRNKAILTHSVINTYKAKLTLHNSSFVNNSAIVDGTLSILNTVAYLSGVFFEGNSAFKGSCIVIASGKVLLTKTTFQINNGRNVINCNSKSELSITDSVFWNHSSPADPLIDISHSQVFLMNSIFVYNQMGVEGGIIHAANDGLVLNSSRFEYNSGRYGTVIYLSQDSSLRVFETTFQQNRAIAGGVMYITSGGVHIMKSHFRDNFAKSFGGAILGKAADVRIEESTFSNHRSPLGGILYLINSNLLALNSRFENSSAHMGGAIYKNYKGKIIINNCSLNMNVGDYGGTIYSLESFSLRISNTTCKFVPTSIKKRGCIDFDYFITCIGLTFTLIISKWMMVKL